MVTESSDLREAVRLGINWSPKLHNALGTPAVQRAFLFGHRLDRESVVAFPGTVDFSGTRVVLPGPDFFPVLPGTHAGPVLYLSTDASATDVAASPERATR